MFGHFLSGLVRALAQACAISGLEEELEDLLLHDEKDEKGCSS